MAQDGFFSSGHWRGLRETILLPSQVAWEQFGMGQVSPLCKNKASCGSSPGPWRHSSVLGVLCPHSSSQPHLTSANTWNWPQGLMMWNCLSPICHTFQCATTSMECTHSLRHLHSHWGEFQAPVPTPHYLSRTSIPAKHRPALQSHKRTQPKAHRVN